MNVTNLTIDGSSSKTIGYWVIVEHRKTSLTKTQQLIIIIFQKKVKKENQEKSLV